jgi:hypothetical protein
MKTLKFALLTALIACTMVSLANADGFKGKPEFNVGVTMTLENAIKIPGLVRAMYQQIIMQDLIDAHQHVYIAEVYYDGIYYHIKGTFDQWMRFFTMDGGLPANILKEKNIN